MKFRSRTTSETVRIASTSGHIVLVGNDFVEVPDHMVADAYAAGCISEDMYLSIKDELQKQAEADAKIDRPAVVDEKMQQMLDSEDKSYFTKEGLPNKKVLNTLCGFTVSNDEFEKVWQKIVTARDAAVQVQSVPVEAGQ